ncbi:spermidine/putrescine ABC transporter permease [Sinorhizobium sp. LM21]|nr:spermidine/putrescine ABC transporter permease [Sinorhizobium sp. LM21]
MTIPHWLRVALLLLPGVGLIGAFIGSVVFIAIAQSFGYYNLSGESAFTLDYWRAMLDRRLFERSVAYSLYVGLFSAVASVIIAYPLALWLRKPFPGSSLIGAVLKAPLLVHGLVAAFLYVNVIAYHGIVNQFMQWIGLWTGPRVLQNDDNAIGVLILQTWKNMPFALLLLTGAVQAISDDVLDAARDMGSGPFARFRKVVAPLTVSALQAAMVIIFIGAVADYSFQAIAGPINRQSMAQLMVFFKGDGQWNNAAVVGVSLMAIALIGSGLLALVARLFVKGASLR